MIADVGLPDGSGTDVAKVAADRGAKTVLMTGHPDEAEVCVIRKIAHLRKPFSLEEFAKVIEEHVGAGGAGLAHARRQ